jgi:hypothetical protein
MRRRSRKIPRMQMIPMPRQGILSMHLIIEPPGEAGPRAEPATTGASTLQPQTRAEAVWSAATKSKSRQLAPEQVFNLCGGHAHAHIEAAKDRINGAHFVKAHFVDQLFENDRIIRKQINAPLPVVEPD